ncbi:MAG: hypothetical protein GY927_04485 [bacterium]|nr:hypothetical protein [bacterium]
MFTWLTNYLVGSDEDRAANEMARQLYAAIVAQARHPVFYRYMSVADSIQGRFELLSLHMFIVLDRLSSGDETSEQLAQQLVDVMFADMDDVARETGVGDMGVGPRIKKLARSFQSRLEYYKQTIDGDEDGTFSRGTLSDALIEVFFADDEVQMHKAEQLAAYVVKQKARVAELSLDEMVAGTQLFADLDEKEGS